MIESELPKQPVDQATCEHAVKLSSYGRCIKCGKQVLEDDRLMMPVDLKR